MLSFTPAITKILVRRLQFQHDMIWSLLAKETKTLPLTWFLLNIIEFFISSCEMKNAYYNHGTATIVICISHFTWGCIFVINMKKFGKPYLLRNEYPRFTMNMTTLVNVNARVVATTSW